MIRYAKDVKLREVTGFMPEPANMVAMDYLTELPPHMRLFSKMTITPGPLSKMHPHPGQTEINFIVKGKALFIDNGKEYILEPGDVHINYDGEEHAVAAYGEEPVEMICCFVYTD